MKKLLLLLIGILSIAATPAVTINGGAVGKTTVARRLPFIMLTVGDSKSMLPVTWSKWLTYLHEKLSVEGDGSREYMYASNTLADGGWKVADVKAVVDARIAAMIDTPTVVLSNLGVNSIWTLVDETTWKADYQYIIDAIHARWPNTMIYLAKPWRTYRDDNADTLAGWVDDLLTANPGYTTVGHDERIWLENGDNGATMTSDNLHYSIAGHHALAAQWFGILID